MRKIIITSITLMLMLCISLLTPGITEKSYADADNAILGEERLIFEKYGDLYDDDSWTTSFSTERSCMLNFEVFSNEYLDADFDLTVKDSNTNKTVYYASDYVNEDTDFYDGIALEPGSYTITFTNTDLYWMYYELYIVCQDFYTVDDPYYSLNKSELTVYTNKTAQLQAQAAPEPATVNSVIWSSSNPTVATVDANGKVTGIAPGTAIITANIDGINRTCEVTVKAPTYSLNNSYVPLYVSQTWQLKMTVTPANYGLGTVKWTSSNPKVATVDAKGIVKGVNSGTATISAAVNGVTKECTFKVKAPEYSSLNYKAVTLYAKQTLTLKLNVTPASYGLAGLKWTSSKPSVASVSSKGVVTAKAKGTTTITAKVNGVTRTCTVTVKPMTLSASKATIYVGKTKALKIYGGTGTTTWKTSNKKVATVTSKGVVKAIKPGTATISAKRNGKTVKCTVTVKYAPETGTTRTLSYKFSYDKDVDINMRGPGSITITMKNKTSDWDPLYGSLYNPNADRVWSNSVSEGKSLTRTINTTQRGIYSLYFSSYGNCEVTIKITTKPCISKTSLKVGKNCSESLTTYGVKNGGKWSSSNTKVATVTSKGVVKGKKKGTCYIKYTLKTGKVLKCKVTVVNPVTCTTTYISDTAIYNECGIKFTNYTSKKITYIKLNIKQYDNRGKRVKSPYDYFYYNNTLKAKSSIEWEYWVNGDSKKCKPYITKVYFSDGTTWKP